MALALPAALRHPLLERDYSRLCSRPTFFLNRTLAVAACGAIVLSIYASGLRWRTVDQIGLMVHRNFTWMTMLAVFLLALTESALAVPAERAANSLPVLLTAPMTPRKLAAGFLLSRVLLALTLLLALLPIEGLSLLLGGVSGGDLLYAAGSIVVAGTFGAGVGFLAGHGAPDGRRAIARAGAAAVILVLLLPLFLGVLTSTARRGALPFFPDGGRGIHESLGQTAFWSIITTPAGPLLHLLFGMTPPRFPLSASGTLQASAASAGVWVLLALLSAGRRLRLETDLEAVASGRGGIREALRRLLRRSPGKADRAEDTSLDFRPRVWKLPLLWKESRPPRSLPVRVGMWAIYAGVFALYAWLFLNPRIRRTFTEDRRDLVYDLCLCIPLWLSLLFVTFPAAGFLAEERDRNSLDLLRVSPLGPRQYILARPLGTALRAAPLFATFLFFLGAGVLFGLVHPLTPVCCLAGAVLVFPALTLLSFQRGITASSVRVANRRAAFVLGLLLGYPILVGMVADFFRWGDRSIAVLAADPLVAISGPIILLAERLRPDEDAFFFGVAACIGCGVWAAIGALLWFRLPRMLTEGLHRDEKR